MAKKQSLAEKVDSTVATEKTVETSVNNFDKLRVLTNDLNKHYGSNVIKTGDNIPRIYKVRSDEPAIDFTNNGGYPISRMIEALGQEHSGKTRNGLIAMGKWQKYCFNCHTNGSLKAEWELDENKFPSLKSCSCSNCSKPKTCIQVMVDIEGTTDPDFMHLFGIDILGVLYFRPKLFSQAVDIVDAYIRNPLVGFIMLDSIASIGADKEIENQMQENKMNQNALQTNQAIRKWQAALNANTNEDPESPTTLYIVNQSYSSIGMYSYEIPQGGRGIRHGKGLSMKTRIEEKVTSKNKTQVLGVHIKIENTKNKTGIPYRFMSYYISLEGGENYCQSDKQLQIVDLAVAFGIVSLNGSWYSYEGIKIGQGKDKVVELLRDNEELYLEIKEKVYAAIGQ